jgi:carotenoid 1,2-hydratase
VSDDGRSAVVVIALLGNPFSPAYSRGRQRDGARALSFCSMNVAIYGRGASAWSLAEREVAEGDRAPTGVSIGASAMRWAGDRLVVEIDERTTPMGRPVRGRIVVHPETRTGLELTIDERAEHRWWPIAPLSRIEVDLPLPGVRFSGHGYHDANAGAVPLESSFESWNWSRARSEHGALLTYDVACSSGTQRSLAFEVSRSGRIEPLENLRQAPLRRTKWGLEQMVRADEGHDVRQLRSLEDGPFYTRALVETRLGGHRVVAMHEVLAAHRLRRPWVRFLTAFRMRDEK